MTDAPTCPQCEHPLPANAPGGLCPSCLISAAMDSSADQASDLASERKPASFQPPDPVTLSKLFPQLEVLELVGQGGMGAVYKARQTKLDRLVALKVIRPEAATDAAFTERFNREARTMARLNHPGIVGIHDFGDVELNDPLSDAAPTPLYYFVMEFVEGPNLRERIRSGNVGPGEAVGIVLQVCEALQFAHDSGVVHRDIKPENILLDQYGHVKIADFGLAKLVIGSDWDYTLTQTHQVMGTPRYMAPEQMSGTHAVDHRADLYSLGVVLYELLTGEFPAGHFDPPSHTGNHEPELDDIVLKALATDPNRRYQQAREFAFDLQSDSGVFTERVPVSAGMWPGPSTIFENAAGRVVDGVRSGDAIRLLMHPGAPVVTMMVLCLLGVLNVLSPWHYVTDQIHRATKYGPIYGYEDMYGVFHAGICFASALFVFATWNTRWVPNWRPFLFLTFSIMALVAAGTGLLDLQYGVREPRFGLHIGFGLSLLMLVVTAWDVRVWAGSPKRLKTRRARSSTSQSSKTEFQSGRDWATLTREQIEADRLPDVCMVCGTETDNRVSKKFCYQPNWTEAMSKNGIFTGALSTVFGDHRIWIASPLCPTHRSVWTSTTIFASVGWLIVVVAAGIGVGIGIFVDNDSPAGAITLGVIGGAIALTYYIVVLVRMVSRCPTIETVTDDKFRLRRVSPIFARAAEEHKAASS